MKVSLSLTLNGREKKDGVAARHGSDMPIYLREDSRGPVFCYMCRIIIANKDGLGTDKREVDGKRKNASCGTISLVRDSITMSTILMRSS